MIIAAMISEKPTVGVDRLPDFAALPLCGEEHEGITFELCFSRTIKTCAEADHEELMARMWRVELESNLSRATITTSRVPSAYGPPEEFVFDALSPEGYVTEGGVSLSKPHILGLERQCTLPASLLIDISQAIFGGQ